MVQHGICYDKVKDIFPKRNIRYINFSDEKSTQMTIARSAVGLTSAGDVILVSGVNCTTEQLAEIMLKLDVVRAISMNGGAFSGLYVNGQYVVKPSRNMSNALVFKIS